MTIELRYSERLHLWTVWVNNKWVFDSNNYREALDYKNTFIENMEKHS